MKDEKNLRFALSLLAFGCLSIAVYAAELKVPPTVQAGAGLSIPTEGSGSATLYVVGPGMAVKRKVQLGQDIQLSGDELKNAGTLCDFA